MLSNCDKVGKNKICVIRGKTEIYYVDIIYNCNRDANSASELYVQTYREKRSQIKDCLQNLKQIENSMNPFVNQKKPTF